MMQSSSRKLPLFVIKAPSGLGRAILDDIQAKKRRAVLIGFWTATAFSVLSAGSVVFVFLSLATGLRESGFWEFISMGLSDLSSVFDMLPTLGMSLLEVVPVSLVVVSLALVLILARSVKGVVENASGIYSRRISRIVLS